MVVVGVKGMWCGTTPSPFPRAVTGNTVTGGFLHALGLWGLECSLDIDYPLVGQVSIYNRDYSIYLIRELSSVRLQARSVLFTTMSPEEQAAWYHF